MPITKEQVSAIRTAHARGALDPAIAQHAGVSLATVKRYRKTLGLETPCITARRGSEGERTFADLAADQGLRVVWRPRENAEYDLRVEGRRVDVKTALRGASRAWRFRLPEVRPSFRGRFAYPKRLEDDCDVLALVCQHPEGGRPDVYLLESRGLPSSLTLRRGGPFERHLEAWEVFDAPLSAGPALKA